MKTSRFIREGQPPPQCDRLYFGHPSCPAFLWNGSQAPRTDQPLTVVLPPVMERHLQARDRFVEMLAQRNPSPQLEISAGDFGTLCYLNRFRAANALPWALSAGPLIGYQDTDPAMERYLMPSEKRTPVWADGQPTELFWEPPSADLIRHWATPQVFSELALLRELGVTRLELCAQPLPWRAAEIGMPVTVYAAAFLSVFPCREDCPCGDGCAIGSREGRVLRRDQNLLYYACDTYGDGVDRLVEFP